MAPLLPSGTRLLLIDGVSPFGSTSTVSSRSPGSFSRATSTPRFFFPLGTSNAKLNVCAGEKARALPPVIVPPKRPPAPVVGTTVRTMTGTATVWPPELWIDAV